MQGAVTSRGPSGEGVAQRLAGQLARLPRASAGVARLRTPTVTHSPPRPAAPPPPPPPPPRLQHNKRREEMHRLKEKHPELAARLEAEVREGGRGGQRRRRRLG